MSTEMFKRIILPLFILLILPFFQVVSQGVQTGAEESDLKRVARDLDSLVSSWQIRMALGDSGLMGQTISGEVIHEFPDSVYIDRLSRINTLFQLPYNNIIRNHIHVYTRRQPTSFSVILGLQDYYFPMIEDIFDSYGVPTELKYMAVIESALNPNAVSRVGATGLWQFMHSTGRMYGLIINSVVDERRDPVKATHAAARYLLDLHKTYNDWFLALSAYNCGPGNVNKAIARSGNKRDYWEIYNRLPRETRGYVPQYIAAMYAMNYHHKHNIVPAPLNLPVSRDTIVVNRDLHLRQIEAVTGLSYNELRALNPQYRTGLIPGKTRPSHITLPTSYLSEFIIMQDSIENYRANVFLAKATPASTSASAYVPPDMRGRPDLSTM
jgi:membrane-bound lytic murein transglycosylase D